MKRRAFLSLGTTAVGLTAGCGRHSQEEPTSFTTSTQSATTSQSTTSRRTETSSENQDTLYVAPDGYPWNPGTADAPLGSIHEGLQRAEPGDTIQVASGEYLEGEEFDKPVQTVRDGQPNAPITITGPRDAILRPSLRIRHSHIHLRGLSIEGLVPPMNPATLDSYPTAPSPDINPISIRPFHDVDQYLTDVVCEPHAVGFGAFALINVFRTIDLEIGPTKITGLAGASWILPDTPDSHAGEIIYLGSPPGIVYEDFYPWSGLDRTRNVHVHHIDNSEGHPHSELVDAKLGTSDVVIEYCTDGGGSQNNEAYPGGSVALRSHKATLRWCKLRDGGGYGVKIIDPIKWLEQHDEAAIDPSSYEGNSVYRNSVTGFNHGPIEIHTEPDEQTILCGNEFGGSTGRIGTQQCPPDIPEGDGIGHLGGDSPWD